jgi:cell division septation protein DedD
VRAGPFKSRDAAEKARDKLKALGLEVGQVAQR